MLLAPSAPPGKVAADAAFAAPADAPAGADPNPWLPGRFSPLADWVCYTVRSDRVGLDNFEHNARWAALFQNLHLCTWTSIS